MAEWATRMICGYCSREQVGPFASCLSLITFRLLPLAHHSPCRVLSVCACSTLYFLLVLSFFLHAPPSLVMCVCVCVPCRALAMP